MTLGWLLWHKAYIKFRENRSTGSKVETDDRLQKILHDYLVSLREGSELTDYDAYDYDDDDDNLISKHNAHFIPACSNLSVCVGICSLQKVNMLWSSENGQA